MRLRTYESIEPLVNYRFAWTIGALPVSYAIGTCDILEGSLIIKSKSPPREPNISWKASYFARNTPVNSRTQISRIITMRSALLNAVSTNYLASYDKRNVDNFSNGTVSILPSLFRPTFQSWQNGIYVEIRSIEHILEQRQQGDKYNKSLFAER